MGAWEPSWAKKDPLPSVTSRPPRLGPLWRSRSQSLVTRGNSLSWSHSQFEGSKVRRIEVRRVQITMHDVVHVHVSDRLDHCVDNPSCDCDAVGHPSLH